MPSRRNKKRTCTRKAPQKQQGTVPKGTPAIPKHSKTTQEQRSVNRRSARLQQLTAKPPIPGELLPVKCSSRNRQVNVIPPRETTLETSPVPRRSRSQVRTSTENSTRFFR